MRTVGKYTLLTKLGEGGMADVHLATRGTSTDPKDLVVVKVPKPEVCDDPEFSAMFLDEARLAARLEHPNIVKTLEVGEADGTQYITMEYMDGQPFGRVIQQIPDLPLNIHLSILADVLRAIDYAHELTDADGKPLNIVHRDLTPQNVLVTYDGVVKILDFGIARAEGRAAKTRQGQFKGKVTYMSPEQARGRELDRRADLFAVGVMLYEACTKERMWKGVKEVDVLTTLLARRHPRNPQLVDPTVHDDLDAICHRALSVIEHRYQTAREMMSDLEKYLNDNVEMATQQDIAEALQAAFADRRAVVQARIESKLKQLIEGGVRESKPEIETPAEKTPAPPNKPPPPVSAKQAAEPPPAGDEEKPGLPLDQLGTVKMAAMLVAAALIASLLTLVVKSLF